jgi:hypothetical protein
MDFSDAGCAFADDKAVRMGNLNLAAVGNSRTALENGG